MELRRVLPHLLLHIPLVLLLLHSLGSLSHHVGTELLLLVHLLLVGHSRIILVSFGSAQPEVAQSHRANHEEHEYPGKAAKHVVWAVVHEALTALEVLFVGFLLLFVVPLLLLMVSPLFLFFLTHLLFPSLIKLPFTASPTTSLLLPVSLLPSLGGLLLLSTHPFKALIVLVKELIEEVSWVLVSTLLITCPILIPVVVVLIAPPVMVFMIATLLVTTLLPPLLVSLLVASSPIEVASSLTLATTLTRVHGSGRVILRLKT